MKRVWKVLARDRDSGEDGVLNVSAQNINVAISQAKKKFAERLVLDFGKDEKTIDLEVIQAEHIVDLD